MLELTALARPPFVGRERELEVLSARLALAGQGHGHTVLVAGEPGVGKTRLVTEVANRARADGWITLIGRAYDSDGMPPYLPWTEALRGYVRACPRVELRAQLGDGAAAVALVVPDVRARLLEPFSVPSLNTKHERYRLFESVSEFLLNIAPSRPGTGVLLVLDDLHWADRPTLLLLGHLARRLVDAPILVVGTYRSVRFDRRHPLSAVLADLSRERLYERVLLRSFTAADVADLLRNLTGTPAAPSVVEVIHRETEGNPFFVEEVVRHLCAEGHDLADPKTVLTHRSVPEGVRQVLGQRLSRLSPVANQLLQVAVVLGDGFRFDMLAVASDIEAGPLVDALEETVAAGVIEDQNGRYYFKHALIRQTLNEELSAPRRALLHHQVGEALERLHGANPEAHLAELARHFCASARVQNLPKALRYAHSAAERAGALLAYEEEARLHQLALQALDLADAPDEARRADLFLALGDARRKAGQLHEAMEAFQRAAHVGRIVGNAEWLARAALGYEDALLSTGVPRPRGTDPSLMLLEEALYALPPDDSALRARLLASLGRASHFAGFGERAAALNDEAVATARRAENAAALAYALNTRCMAATVSEDPAERLATATELLRLAEEAGDAELALEGRRWRLQARLEMGNLAEVDTEIAAYASVAAGLRRPQYLSHVALWRAMRALMEGRFAEGEALAGEMLATGRRAQRREADFAYVAQMLTLHNARGDLARLAEIEPVVRENADREPLHPVRRAHLAHLFAVLDRPAEARAELERIAVDDFSGIPRDLVWLFTLTVLVEVCAFLGDARRLATLCELMRPYEDRHVVGGIGVVYRGPVAHYLGLAAATLGRGDDALAHFQLAATLARRADARAVLARTVEAQSGALLRLSRPADHSLACALLEQAQAMYDALEMPHDAVSTRARLADRHGRGALPRSTRPASLTEREMQVLRLIAAGKSNREIADALVISERTVERHVTNLYGKIDARGRADATAYAFTHRLV